MTDLLYSVTLQTDRLSGVTGAGWPHKTTEKAILDGKRAASVRSTRYVWQGRSTVTIAIAAAGATSRCGGGLARAFRASHDEASFVGCFARGRCRRRAAATRTRARLSCSRLVQRCTGLTLLARRAALPMIWSALNLQSSGCSSCTLLGTHWRCPRWRHHQ